MEDDFSGQTRFFENWKQIHHQRFELKSDALLQAIFVKFISDCIIKLPGTT